MPKVLQPLLRRPLRRPPLPFGHPLTPLEGVGYAPIDWDTHAQAWIATQTPTPAYVVQSATNTLVKRFKSCGLWDLCDEILLPVVSTSLTDALRGLKQPSVVFADAPLGGTLVANKGFQGNGTSQYIRLPILSTLTLFGANQNTGFIGEYITDAGNKQAQFGTTTTANNLINTTGGGTAFTGRLNGSGTALSWVIDNILGLMLLARRSSSLVGAYKGNLNLGDLSSASVAISGSLRGCIGRNSTAYSTDTFGAAFIGAGTITDDMAAAADAALSTFFASIGGAPSAAPVTPTVLTVTNEFALPDLPTSPAGLGFTGTGLFLDSDGSKWVSDHGAFYTTDAASAAKPAIHHISADNLSLLGTIAMGDLGLGEANLSGQGVCNDNDPANFWGVNKTRNAALASTKVFKATKAGVLLQSTPVSGANGIGWWAADGLPVVAGSSTIAKRNATTPSIIVGAPITGLAGVDQIFCESDRNLVWWSGNAAGKALLNRLTVNASFGVTATAVFELPSSYYDIEGFVIDRANSRIIIVFDGGYHQNGNKRNVIVYCDLPAGA